jgi:hypothetical protein
MANNNGSQHQSRPPIRLVISVLLLGTLLAWWGTRDRRDPFGESLRQPVAAASMVLPQVKQENSALLDRGPEISQRQCAGCHEGATRTSAPSYQEIVVFYRRAFPNAAGNPDLRSRLASAVMTCVDITVLHFSVIDKVEEEFSTHLPRRIAKGTTIPIRETYSLQF